MRQRRRPRCGSGGTCPSRRVGEYARSTTPLATSTAAAGTPTRVPIAGGGPASNSIPPTMKLATGSAIVMAVSAVGRDPLAKASCTSRAPNPVDSTRHTSGQSETAPMMPRRPRSSVTSTRKTAVRQKHIPAPTATSAVRIWARPRSIRARASRPTIAAAIANAIRGTVSRCASVCGTAPRTTTSRLSPAHTPAVPSQSRRSGRLPIRAVARGKANSSCATRSAWTIAIEPRCRAAACRPKPTRFAAQPISQRGSLASRTSRPSTGSQTRDRSGATEDAADDATRRSAASRADACCIAADTAKNSAASSASPTLAIVTLAIMPDRYAAGLTAPSPLGERRMPSRGS